MAGLKKLGKLFGIAVLGFLGLAGIMVIIASSSDKAETPVSQPVKQSINIGDNAIIKVGIPEVFLGVTEQDQEVLGKSLMAKDTMGISNLLSNQKVFLVKEGTKVLVIDRAYGIRNVRIMEGVNTGKTGWLPYEWLSK